MPKVYPSTIGVLSTGDSLGTDTGVAVEQIRTQTNSGPQLFTLGNKGQAPRGVKKGSLTNAFHPRGILLTAYGDKGTSVTTVIPRNSIDNIPTTEGTGVPTLTEFPNDGEYGWKIDPGVAGYWSINWEGTVYWATAVAGGITFASISGTITNDQHGGLGRQTGGGSPHHTNATTSQPGFLSTAFFDLLNGATENNTASTIVMRSASREIKCVTLTATDVTAGGVVTGNSVFSTNTVEATSTLIGNTADVTVSYKVGSTKVVGARNTGWAAFTGGTDKGTTYDTSTITVAQLAERVSSLQNALSGHGLID